MDSSVDILTGGPAFPLFRENSPRGPVKKTVWADESQPNRREFTRGDRIIADRCPVPGLLITTDSRRLTVRNEENAEVTLTYGRVEVVPPCFGARTNNTEL